MLIVFVTLLALLTQAPAAVKPPENISCALLSDADVRAVLGVDVTEHQPAPQEARGLLLSQCFLGTGTPRSVSIAVVGNMTAGNQTITARTFWREQFHNREVEQEDEAKAKAMAGLGDEAFWSGSRVAGALYVLRGNTFLRVSVGGISDEKERIEKSRQLAIAALARLK